MTEPRRECTGCHRKRAERFYVSPRGRKCADCRKRRTRYASRDVHLVETYGITQAEYDALLAAQGGKCAICRGTRPGNLDCDHDHALVRAGHSVRDSIRGLLCRRCNRRLLPAAQDSVERLRDVIAYLENPPAQKVLA